MFLFEPMTVPFGERQKPRGRTAGLFRQEKNRKERLLGEPFKKPDESLVFLCPREGKLINNKNLGYYRGFYFLSFPPFRICFFGRAFVIGFGRRFLTGLIGLLRLGRGRFIIFPYQRFMRLVT